MCPIFCFPNKKPHLIQPARFFGCLLKIAVARVVAVVVFFDIVFFNFIVAENIIVVAFGVLNGNSGFNCIVNHY